MSIKRVLDFQNTGKSQLAGISRQFCNWQASTSCHDDDKDTAWRIGCSATEQAECFVGFGPRMQSVILRVESKRGCEMLIPIVAAIVVLLLYIAMRIARVRLVRVTVYEFQRALRYRKGLFLSVLGPGQYWILEPRTTVTPASHPHKEAIVRRYLPAAVI